MNKSDAFEGIVRFAFIVLGAYLVGGWRWAIASALFSIVGIGIIRDVLNVHAQIVQRSKK